MSIHLNQAYKILPSRQKRYESHYGIPASNSVVVPVRELGAEVSCDIRWEDANGELKVIHHAMFVRDNLVPLNPLLDTKLFEIWAHYYQHLANKNG